MAVSKSPSPPICPYCQNRAKAATGADIYPHRPDLASKQFFLCRPCGAWCGTHADGGSLGFPANLLLRNLRRRTHALFDPLWQDGAFTARSAAYKWLAGEMKIKSKRCHVAQFTEVQCLLALEVLSRRRV